MRACVGAWVRACVCVCVCVCACVVCVEDKQEVHVNDMSALVPVSLKSYQGR